MTLKDWLKLNPDHFVVLTSHPGDQVRVILKGGDGVDQRLVGDGENETLAIGAALRTRARIVEQLTLVPPSP